MRIERLPLRCPICCAFQREERGIFVGRGGERCSREVAGYWEMDLQCFLYMQLKNQFKLFVAICTNLIDEELPRGKSVMVCVWNSLIEIE